MLAGPRALAEVLVTRAYDFQKPAQIRWSLSRILGEGLLIAEGDVHRQQRRGLLPAFSYRHVKDLYPVFWDKSREAALALEEHVRREEARLAAEGEAAAAAAVAASNAASPRLNDPETKEELVAGGNGTGTASPVVEVGGWLSRATLDIIGVAAMGRDFGAIRDPDNTLARTYSHVFAPSRQAQVLALLSLLLPGWFVDLLPIKRNQDVATAAAVIRQTCSNLIEAKKAKLELKGPVREGVQMADPDPDLLSIALRSGVFTDENLVDQLMTFLAAGHETTATAMTWAIYLLCLHPDAQRRLRDEVRANLPSLDDTTASASVTAAQLDRLPYLNAVCAEVLRVYPPVPMTMREARVDTTIMGRSIPKGTHVVVSPWATNRDPALWGQDADRFDPDRWLRSPSSASTNTEGKPSASQNLAAPTPTPASIGSGGARSNYAFLTFLQGPRSCIGERFARAEFACLLACWVGRFEFDLADPELRDESKVEIKGGVTARPAKGMHVRVKVLEGW